MKPVAIILWSFALVLFSGCASEGKRLPSAAGGQGEVLVVMSKGHWDGPPGAAVRDLLQRPAIGLPQQEPRFKVAQTTPEAFGDLLSVHHNVLHAVIDQSVDSNAIKRSRDVYARGQLLVRVAANDPQQWIDVLHTQGVSLLDLFEEHHRQRIISNLAAQRDETIHASLQAAHELSLEVPSGFRVVEQDASFSWLQRDRMIIGSGMEHNVIEGILVYHYPYTSDSTFNVEYLIDKRDSLTEQYVSGPVDGSHMIVQRAFGELDLMPNSRMTELKGRFAYLMHGLFGMHGAKMGGPFVSLTTIDEERGRVVTVEGFVYAPQFNKREYMRELEAVLFTLHLEPASGQ